MKNKIACRVDHTWQLHGVPLMAKRGCVGNVQRFMDLVVRRGLRENFSQTLRC